MKYSINIKDKYKIHMVGYILYIASLLGDVLPAGVSPDLSPLPGAL